jgi:hypothetical protein
MSEDKTDFDVKVNFQHGQQKPSYIPILPALNVGRSFYGLGGEVYDSGDVPNIGKRYERVDDESLTIYNGPDSFNQVLMGDGVWYLHIGDKPKLKLSHRCYSGSSYIKPDLIPDLGIGGELNIAVCVENRIKRLENFNSIKTVFSSGSATWKCFDSELNVTIELMVNPLIKTNGFIASLKANSQEKKDVTLIWEFGQIGEKNDSIVLKKNYAQFSNPNMKYTLVLAGSLNKHCKLVKSNLNSIIELKEDDSSNKKGNQKVLYTIKLNTDSQTNALNRFLCIWGYNDYNKKGVKEAYNRLETKPFADREWLKEMKRKWFHHWIGRALEPEKRFLHILNHIDEAIKEYKDFWNKSTRLHIKTPDPQLDTTVNRAAMELRYQFEYPAFIHGIYRWNKYGKINIGYYAADDIGYHKEVNDSIKFISGAQDEKGRQCYLSPAFGTIRHAEEVNFYYVEQAWYHYRWTGDLKFLRVMWPSIKRALDHSLAASDPDNDGLMTGYYEFWQNDAHSRGGKCAVQTGMACVALKSAIEIAKLVNDEKATKRYEELLKRVEEHLTKQLWSKEVGAFCSAEWNGNMRPHPEAQEQFLLIMRGLGDPMQKYMAMRYIRENLFLKPTPEVILQLINDWWPIFWSHHYVSNGDTALSVLAACEAGDLDNYWKALRTIVEGSYYNKYATLMNTQNNYGIGTGLKHTIEVQAPFLQAVIEGLFGVKPYLHNNLLVFRPSFPSDWKHSEISTPDFSYSFYKEEKMIRCTVRTPVKRKIRLEVPVKGEIHRIKVNGKKVKYSYVSGINSARILIESDPVKRCSFEVHIGKAPTVEEKKQVIACRKTRFLVKNGVLKRILDPQRKIKDASIKRCKDNIYEASFIPVTLGMTTVFLEIAAGDISYLYPLDLDVKEQWSIIERYITAFNDGGPTVSSPKINMKNKSLMIEIKNNDDVELRDRAVINVAGKIFLRELILQPLNSTMIKIPLVEVWDKLSPGTTRISIEFLGKIDVVDAVNWDIGNDQSLPYKNRFRRINLEKHYNTDLTYLYSSRFKWRLDYTGCSEGVDWRDPMPEKDTLGYILMHPPLSQLAWGCLPEHAYGLEYIRTKSDIKYDNLEFDILWDVPEFLNDFKTPIGIPFKTGTLPIEQSNWYNILVLTSTEPYEQLPSTAILEFKKPTRLEKMYLLTANLTKSLKCYYPGAEIIIHYVRGEEEIIQLTPPYTMSCMAQPFSPYSFSIPFGKFIDPSKATNALAPEKIPNLDVSDIVLDSKRKIKQIELRCVTSETILGILGITILEAET